MSPILSVIGIFIIHNLRKVIIRKVIVRKVIISKFNISKVIVSIVIVALLAPIFFDTLSLPVPAAGFEP
jgi:hypothetical protein